MKIDIVNDKIIIFDKEDFSVEKTLECGQLFRFYKLVENDYNVVSSDKICNIKEFEDRVVITTKFIDYFYNYFDLDTNYGKIHNSLACFVELNEILSVSKGIRILRQDLFETIISFIISANNNIPRIKGIIEKLSHRYGENFGEYNAFVSRENLANVSELEFKELGTGYRANYLFSSAQTLKDDNFLSELKKLNAKDAKAKLFTLKGIGEKVASCVMLFGLSHKSSFPVDTWIQKACENEMLDTPNKIQTFYENRYKENSGYAQQCIFYSKRNLHM